MTDLPLILRDRGITQLTKAVRTTDAKCVYVPGSFMRHLALSPEVTRVWLQDGRPLSLQIHKTIVKPWDAFHGEHTTTDAAWQRFMRECARYNCPRPASYGSVFHRLYRSPLVKWTYNNALLEGVVGAWEEARVIGKLEGHCRLYDINSAYRFACEIGLPDPDTYRHTEDAPKLRADGVYWCEFSHTRDDLPYPYNVTRWCLTSLEEVEVYGHHPRRIIRGVRWKKLCDPAPMAKALGTPTFARHMSRAFWGRWISTSRIYQKTQRLVEGTPLKNPTLNVVWGHIIMARVKLKVWQSTNDIAHVFVDSLITRDELPTGTKVGDFRLVKEYPGGVKIRHAGFFGDARDTTWDRTSGTQRHNSEV